VHVFERIRGAALLRTSINGGLARAIYAPIALAFVLVYKASRMINFALGEWIMFDLAVAARSGEGPFTYPLQTPNHRALQTVVC
jgi:hypothetical protein